MKKSDCFFVIIVTMLAISGTMLGCKIHDLKKANAAEKEQIQFTPMDSLLNPTFEVMAGDFPAVQFDCVDRKEMFSVQYNQIDKLQDNEANWLLKTVLSAIYSQKWEGKCEDMPSGLTRFKSADLRNLDPSAGADTRPEPKAVVELKTIDLKESKYENKGLTKEDDKA